MRYYPLLEDWGVKRERAQQILQDYHGLYIMIYWCLADPTQQIHVRITSEARAGLPPNVSQFVRPKLSTSLCDCCTKPHMSSHTWKVTPTFMWNSRFSSMANICSKMSSEIRGMIPIPLGSWRFPCGKKKNKRWLKCVSEEWDKCWSEKNGSRRRAKTL